MKFKECKVGDIVTPKTDRIKAYCFRGVTPYIALAKEYRITELNRATKTVDITSTDPKKRYSMPICLSVMS